MDRNVSDGEQRSWTRGHWSSCGKLIGLHFCGRHTLVAANWSKAREKKCTCFCSNACSELTWNTSSNKALVNRPPVLVTRAPGCLGCAYRLWDQMRQLATRVRRKKTFGRPCMVVSDQDIAVRQQ